MIKWVETISDWDQSVPVVLTALDTTAEIRRRRLHDLVVRLTGLPAGAVAIEFIEGRGPVLATPSGADLHLSLSSRGAFAALAIARAPIGVDVEIVDPEGEIPWNVLHPREQAAVSSVRGEARAMTFARLWSLKEAYLKAMGTGLSREPSGFAVTVLDEERASIADGTTEGVMAEARTIWRNAGSVRAAVSAVTLEPMRGA